MKNIFQRLIYALIFCLLFSACSTVKGPPTLANNHWELQDVKGVDIYLAFNIKHGIFIEFNDSTKKFNGYTGCNNFFGEYTVDGNKLHFSDMSTTRMACPQMKSENLYLQAISQVDNYRIDGKKLLLYKGEEVLATYKR
ncbi:META domain-containing protein [Solitalea koreensis]|uniref:Heat shock protein HslJ n=1 Tax=Solitalea koreensis TaxID=543615 RepID=A0A521C924_9SPHI|nr:META domain-containing protein [Solitalea koreensis]SMO55949.1 Heat shock protein HslJ [Solitalea koreensis]